MPSAGLFVVTGRLTPGSSVKSFRLSTEPPGSSAICRAGSVEVETAEVTEMRFRFKPTPEQRSALRAQLARLQQPAEVLAVLRSILPADFKSSAIVCTPQ